MGDNKYIYIFSQVDGRAMLRLNYSDEMGLKH